MVNPKQPTSASAPYDSERLAGLLTALEEALSDINRPLLAHSPLPGLSKLATAFFGRLQRRQALFDQRAADLLHMLALEIEAQRRRIERLEERGNQQSEQAEIS